MDNNGLHTTKISLPEKQRVELIAMINQTLASACDLYLQLKNAHWNVKGLQFIALHKLFDELAEGVEPQIDDLAERVAALGGTALGALQDINTNSQLKAYPAGLCESKHVLEHLAHNLAVLGESTRQNISQAEKYGDIATGDIYIGFTRFLDKNLWFIEAHLQK